MEPKIPNLPNILNCSIFGEDCVPLYNYFHSYYHIKFYISPAYKKSIEQYVLEKENFLQEVSHKRCKTSKTIIEEHW